MANPAFGVLVATNYWGLSPALSGLPGSKIPVGDGQPFGGTIRFQHYGPGGQFMVGFYCDVGGTRVIAVSGTVTLPNDSAWTTYQVNVQGTYHTYGLGHGVSVGTHKFIKYITGGDDLLGDDDADCYLNVTRTEFRNYVVEQYRSDMGYGLPGARVPITQGNSFGATIRFDYRYLGGSYRADVSLNVAGNYERARADFELPNAWEWTTVRKDVVSIEPYDRHGLEHCRLIDCLKEIWGPGGAKLSDTDSECYHNQLPQFQLLVASKYWSISP